MRHIFRSLNGGAGKLSPYALSHNPNTTVTLLLALRHVVRILLAQCLLAPHLVQVMSASDSYGTYEGMHDSKWWEIAVSNGIPRRSFVTMLIVGTILNLINQGI